MILQWNQKFQNFLILQLLVHVVHLLKPNLFWNNSQLKIILISNDFIVPQLHLSRQKCVENVSVINLVNMIKLFCLRFKYNDVFSFIQDILIPFIWLMFLLTQKKASSLMKSLKQKNFQLMHALNFHNLISISFCNLHSFYL